MAVLRIKRLPDDPSKESEIVLEMFIGNGDGPSIADSLSHGFSTDGCDLAFEIWQNMRLKLRTTTRIPQKEA